MLRCWAIRSVKCCLSDLSIRKPLADACYPNDQKGRVEMQGRLNGKALIVIGSGTGIGAATARRLAAEGARICLADVNLAAASAATDEIAAEGGEAFATFIDLADEPSVARATEAAAERLGGLDGAHVNAADMGAIMQDSDALAEELEVFDRTLTVNLRGHLLCTRAVLPHLLARGGGAIVYTSSAAADMGDPLRPAYAASKGGLNALMRHVAAKWGRRGVTANCVAPGYVITPEMRAGGALTSELLSQMGAQTPSLRLGDPADIAAMVAMLLSDDGRWMNGQVYHVNGGALMR